MKAHLNSLLIAALFAGLFSAPTPARAQGKIAVVNLRFLFDNYYKRKIADAKIKERAGELDKEFTEMGNKKKAAEDAYNKATAAANDLAASKEERDRRKADAEQKLTDVKGIEKDMASFRQQAEAILQEQQTRMRSRVLEEIKAEIEARAKADGYYLVLDKDADSKNETKVIVYHNGENDITDVVLKKLNAGAPANLDLDTDSTDQKDQKNQKK